MIKIERANCAPFAIDYRCFSVQDRLSPFVQLNFIAQQECVEKARSPCNQYHIRNAGKNDLDLYAAPHGISERGTQPFAGNEITADNDDLFFRFAERL